MEHAALSVVVVGAGPAGLYAARKLAHHGVQVFLLNRDLLPGGLAEYGIHGERTRFKRGLRAQFTSLLQDPHVTYYGGVEVGVSCALSLAELLSLPVDAILFTHGAQHSAPFSLPGADVEGVWSAKALLYHYAQLPAFAQERQPVLGKRIGLVGQQDVLFELLGWLLGQQGVEELHLIHEGLAPWRQVDGARGGSMLQLGHVAHAVDTEAFAYELARLEATLQKLGEEAHAWKKAIATLKTRSSAIATTGAQVHLHFLSSPKELHAAQGQPTGLTVVRNDCALQGDSLTLQPTAQTALLPIDMLIHATEDRSDPALELPAGAEGGYAFSWPQHQDAPPCFVAGWARSAAYGINVGRARLEGEGAAKAILAALSNHAPREEQDVVGALCAYLDRKGVRYLSHEDLTEVQTLLGKEAHKRGLSAVRFASDEALLTALTDSRVGTSLGE